MELRARAARAAAGRAAGSTGRTLEDEERFQYAVALDAPMLDLTLFLGNLMEGMDDAKLQEEMAKYGELERCFVMRNKEGVSKFYGFAEFTIPAPCVKARKELEQQQRQELNALRQARRDQQTPGKGGKPGIGAETPKTEEKKAEGVADKKEEKKEEAPQSEQKKPEGGEEKQAEGATPMDGEGEQKKEGEGEQKKEGEGEQKKEGEGEQKKDGEPQKVSMRAEFCNLPTVMGLFAKTLYVQGLAPGVQTDAQLRASMETWGPTGSVTLARQPDTNKPKGFGFVEFKRSQHAEAAMRVLNGNTEHHVLGKARASFQNPAKAFENRRALGAPGAVASTKASLGKQKPAPAFQGGRSGGRGPGGFVARGGRTGGYAGRGGYSSPPMAAGRGYGMGGGYGAAGYGGGYGAAGYGVGGYGMGGYGGRGGYGMGGYGAGGYGMGGYAAAPTPMAAAAPAVRPMYNARAAAGAGRGRNPHSGIGYSGPSTPAVAGGYGGAAANKYGGYAAAPAAAAATPMAGGGYAAGYGGAGGYGSPVASAPMAAAGYGASTGYGAGYGAAAPVASAPMAAGGGYAAGYGASAATGYGQGYGASAPTGASMLGFAKS
ncbi:hypothetical protein DUNSADRAFT_5392 [Dunaliella salina]|uniref:RRM domain-containing protein n=1 Tax=Dunaliella salina TaxID=3046 RepID=A0ABQ7GQD0_DUNSA|nr:hypothetical protein DUNSADRAFT_5392 [Dunaliella salina]|eukprot:KAF5836812.1 hypothetical protein DUNSADRAFT_5392 [Dunaliella salina]